MYTLKRAVWDCGGDCAPGLDGFTFKFFTTFWDLLEEDVNWFVQDFFVSGSFPKGCNSSFIALIPKVSGATLVTDFRPISLIGCQYKIISKILANRLSMVIGSCVSPEQSAFIKGRNILDGPLILSEVMAWYRKRKKQLMIFKVDFEKSFDSLRWDFLDLNSRFLGDYDKAILYPLFFFMLAIEGLHAFICKVIDIDIYSGARIGDNNMSLSHLICAEDVIFLGVCVPNENISNMAAILGCGAAALPLKYLGKFSSKLTLWNARLLSTGGCLSLIKSVLGSLPTYYMSLYEVPISVCNKLESMRNNFIIGGDLGEKKMTWAFCLNGFGACSSNLLIFEPSLSRSFMGIMEASLMFPLLNLVTVHGTVELSEHNDSWQRSLDVPKGLCVASARSLIDSCTLDDRSSATRWNNMIPIKVNVFLWRLSLNKLPSRMNLDRKGIEVDSLLCHICHEIVETANHTFFNYEMAQDLWALLDRWWELDIPFCKNISEWFMWLDSSSLSTKARLILDGVGGTLLCIVIKKSKWLNRDGFDDIVKSTWDSLDTGNGNNIISSHVKLRSLKTAIKKWQVDVRNKDRSQKHATLSEIQDIEKNIDDGSTSISDREKRIKLLQDIDKLDNLEALDLIQKARIKWDIEGDENSKYFHGIINSKRRTQAIAGIFHDGDWITDPPLIKNVFLHYYKDKFQAHDSQVIFSPITNSSTHYQPDRDFLESHISLDEVTKAVWECGSNKAPGLDGFSFAFIKKYWDLIKMDIFEFVNSFFVSSFMPQGVISYFFTLISKISNPIFVKDFRPISLIGTHYKIISKILANRLSKVIDKLVSKEQSAFISGRQILDGPLILSEIIQWYRKRKKKMLIFKVDFEKAFDSVSWNYLDFVLDSLGFGSKWRSWIKACLHSSRASILINGSPTSEFFIKRGLRQGDSLSPFLFILVMEGLHCAMSNAINSGIIRGIKLGSPISNDEISSMASRTGCAACCFPFTYLGLPIGANMNITSSWHVLIDRFQKRLSSWKANLLSTGGRLTLIKAVLEGLNIGSLKAFNLALLSKWRWRMFTSPNNMWVTIIKALHGQEGGLDNHGCNFNGGMRAGIVTRNTAYLRYLLMEISQIDISVDEDTCTWSLADDVIFTVRSARCLIYSKLLPSIETSTVWDTNFPRKGIYPRGFPRILPWEKPVYAVVGYVNLRDDVHVMEVNTSQRSKEFSPSISAKVMNNVQVVQEEISYNSGGGSEKNKGGSVLGVLEEMIRVGRAMGYSMEGCLGNKTKNEWIKELTNKNKINFIAIQETKMEKVSHMDVKFMWGNSNYDYVFSESVGNSGGILCIWEESIFKKSYVTISDYFVAIYGTWIPNKTKVLIVAIYAPQQPSLRRVLWDYLSLLLSRWNGEAVLMGDFNEVRIKDERRGTWFNSYNASFFNKFISSSSLVDIKMEGYAFTWSHPSGKKMSKLDRFLVSDGFISLFPSITALCMDRHLSDHRSILLCEVKVDFGPTPFRFYHSWFKFDGFDDMWIKIRKSHISGSINSVSRELRDIDIELEQVGVNDSLNFRRHELICKLNDVKEMAAMDSFQKSKVRWAIEGDENSKYFHGIINKKRSHLDQVVDLERGVSHDEIRAAVWDCGDNKSPGPDGFTFEFFRRYWKFIGPDFCEAVEHFFDHGSFSKGCNSSFIALIPKVMDAKFVNDYRPISLIGSVYKVVTKILANRLAMVIANLVSDTQSAFVANRQILDGPFILNEVLHWCKRKNKQAMFFKVDFAKAYDSVRWDFLIDVLEAFGFGLTWCNWIRGTFCFAKASILVNGSPSDEFQLQCGLRQGDPLPPYLFILVMESLHPSVNRAVDKGVFKGIRLNGSLLLSHLFYADDALFMAEWSDSNLKGCSIMENKFRYLSVMVGEKMYRRKAWDDVVLKLRSRLSRWKAKTLSIGGRLTLLKSVLGASPLYNMSIFKVPKGVLKEMEFIRRGLGVSSYFALNRALLLKWVWRFVSQDGSLWFRVIQAVHGNSIDAHLVQNLSIWSSILKEVQSLKSIGFDFLSHCSKRIGDGSSTGFWLETWKGDKPLRETFPRLFALELNRHINVAMKLYGAVTASFRRPVRGGVEQQQLSDLCSFLDTVILSPAADRWYCSLSSDGVFSVKEARNVIDDLILPSHSEPTRWA
ncbi:RNA-directed DNA polymerase, eukaryota [Tanacetum coccineum]